MGPRDTGTRGCPLQQAENHPALETAKGGRGVNLGEALKHQDQEFRAVGCQEGVGTAGKWVCWLPESLEQLDLWP